MYIFAYIYVYMYVFYMYICMYSYVHMYVYIYTYFFFIDNIGAFKGALKRAAVTQKALCCYSFLCSQNCWSFTL